MSKTIDLGRVVGNSAYEDAVASGYVGTLEQWLASLKGEKGDRGEQGIQGERGIQGVAGQNGQNGADGQNGQDGYSPTVSLSKSGKTTTLVITDKNGTHSSTIVDGNDGQNGQDGRDGTNGTNGTNGADGQDGVSPAVTITSIQGGHQVTITDAEHPQGQSFNVMNGQDGQGVPEIFWAAYGTTTYTEITTANNAGKAVLCWYQNRMYMLSSISATSCILATNTASYVYSITVSSANAWSSTYKQVPNILSNSDSSYAVSSDSFSNYVPTMDRILVITNNTLSSEELTGWQNGYIDVTTTPISDTISPSLSGTKWLRMEVNEGEVYCLNVKGGTASRAYAIADAGKTPIMSAAVSATLYYYFIKIPTGGKYLYLHSSLDLSTFGCYRIKTTKDVEDKIGSAIPLTFTYEDDTTQTYNLLTAPSNS